MIKIDQTVVCRKKGNCMQAQVASLLELPLSDVPNWIEMPENEWFMNYQNFFKTQGYEFLYCKNPRGSIDDVLNDLYETNSIDGFIGASVNSSMFKGMTHAVIINLDGVVVHDPNPNKYWLHKNVVQSGDLVAWEDIIDLH